jgi:FtsZ-binding cell division protein ZapB
MVSGTHHASPELSSLSMKLYEYPESIDRILSEAVDGELTPDLERRLDETLQGFQAKVRSVVQVIRHLDMLVAGCKGERERLAERQSYLEKERDSLKRYLLRCMAHEDTRKVVIDLGVVSRVDNSQPSIRWSWSDRDPPEEFVRVKVVKELDGKAAQQAYRDGRLPEGFTVELGEQLRIR